MYLLINSHSMLQSVSEIPEKEKRKKFKLQVCMCIYISGRKCNNKTKILISNETIKSSDQFICA